MERHVLCADQQWYPYAEGVQTFRLALDQAFETGAHGAR
jgi:hypothetical protein